MKDLEWTRAYPVEEGFYWCRLADGECVVVLAEDPLCTGEMEIYWAGAEEHSTREKTVMVWSGMVRFAPRSRGQLS